MVVDLYVPNFDAWRASTDDLGRGLSEEPHWCQDVRQEMLAALEDLPDLAFFSIIADFLPYIGTVKFGRHGVHPLPSPAGEVQVFVSVDSCDTLVPHSTLLGKASHTQGCSVTLAGLRNWIQHCVMLNTLRWTPSLDGYLYGVQVRLLALALDTPQSSVARICQHPLWDDSLLYGMCQTL